MLSGIASAGSRDDIGAVNERHWDWAVSNGAGCTRPWLGLDADRIRGYATGELEAPHGPMADLMRELSAVFPEVEGRDVLCLAAGGGQQSAVFGLRGILCAYDR